MYIHVCFILIVILVSSFIKLLGPIKMSVTEFKESGNEKFKAGDYEEALSLYTKVE